ncbi:rhodanese-like domain-containing protein [Pollutimonas harenae]|uniref:Sulfurtransferase n=1 Tax=Pollutimonas harenae TaxID=657015 RepID=A0A853H3W1_9BURK|nr:rhodanese-like domain-containing protein [Pollutimonas harenae]NYT84824.1 sulfurtransferase [Pollutimonas harenae]TEA72778.1 sulfurtransferase [Pollutimonas harenae]
MTNRTIEPHEVQDWLYDGRELAFLDVREHGLYGEGHPLFATPLPYSRLELDITRLVPRRSVRVVLFDDDESIAGKAAQRLAAIGYGNVHIVRGGSRGWKDAGYVLFAGVNVPSKTFGELVEHTCRTPRISAAELSRMMEDGHSLLVLDGRPFNEYRKMNIPQAVCCPNGELAYRIHELVPDEKTTVVINCAGRTRSIIGAQTLINLGIPNPVFALENGTQGWYLEGLDLEHGSKRKYSEVMANEDARARSEWLAQQLDVPYVDAVTVLDWLVQGECSVFLCDVRTEEEFNTATLPGAQHTPGGQLIQATDQYVGVRGAHIVLFDDDGVRAPVVAGWLRQMGHDAYVLKQTLTQASGFNWPEAMVPALPLLPLMPAKSVHDRIEKGQCIVVDVRASASYRAGHVPGAVWAIRPRIAEQLQGRKPPFILVADDPGVAALAALELPAEAYLLEGGMDAWEAAGYPLMATSNVPPDAERIDYLFFVHDRHDGNREAARQYLAWETGLLAQLEPREHDMFKPVVVPVRP